MNNLPLRRFAAFTFATLVLALAASASTAHQEGTGDSIEDAIITTKVKAAVLNAPQLKSAEINVETFKGKVQLSGFVSSQANINEAVEVARGVKGVVSVTNAMRLK